jgi:uncharacterized protein
MYVEFQAKDLERTKEFFTEAFGWKFTDYGPDYAAFGNDEFGGGVTRSDKRGRIKEGSPAVVIYTREIEAVRERVISAGGKITDDIFAYPGGRRFHFLEPSGNELGVATIDGN